MTQKGIFKLSQRQDLRSLAAFRIFMSSYLIYDIITRLQNGRYSLLWYTSPGFLDPDDTPHRAPLHRLWFYRGSVKLQIMLFIFTAILIVCYGVGYKCNMCTKTLLWLNLVSMQCRCMPPHDGSDTFVRHMILWTIFLPVEGIWSVDSWEDRNSKYGHYYIQNTVSTWGIRLQIVFMYLGTVMSRTIDMYGWDVFQSPWLPPQLSAVHYAMNSSFATRNTWIANMVRTCFPLSQIMTLFAMIGETFMPILCLFLNDKYIYFPISILLKLHIGLFLLMNLPNWQFVGMLTTSIWIPSHMWDRLQRYLAGCFPKIFQPPRLALSQVELEKKDASGKYLPLNTITKYKRKQIVAYFLLIYMIYDFMGTRKWVTQLDSGDIGESLRFSQFWQMYNGPPRETSQVMLTGAVAELENVNVWEWIKSQKLVKVDMNAFEENIWTNFTHVYPNPRVERAISDLNKSVPRMTYYLNALCNVENNPFKDITATIQTLKILPPNSDGLRFERSRADRLVYVKC